MFPTIALEEYVSKDHSELYFRLLEEATKTMATRDFLLDCDKGITLSTSPNSIAVKTLP